MPKVSYDAPALYGDHHVTEVRRILLALAGVTEVYASSCFQIIEVEYDPQQVSPQVIASRLDEAGYLAGRVAVDEALAPALDRHAVALEQGRSGIGFQQDLPVQTRTAWPCPGMGLLKPREEAHG